MAARKNRNSGFTLLETLLTVAVLVILLGLSIVGVARYRDHLKITELDNAARDIYMAAENRVVLLQNSGADAKLLASGGGLLPTVEVDSKRFHVLSSEDTLHLTQLSDLVPTGSIDPALRDGQFVILYDDTTHHVKEVFYAEEEFYSTSGGTPALDASDYPYRGTRSERVTYYRTNKSSGGRLVGWYSSDMGDEIGTHPLSTPGVEVLIDNGDVLKLSVKYTLPSDAPAGVNCDPCVRLEYKGNNIILLGTAGGGTAAKDERKLKLESGSADFTTVTVGGAVIYTCVLDSLESGKQFKDLITGGLSKLGDDFTVTASLKLTATDYIESSYYATGTDNSLYAKGTNYSGDDITDGTAANTALIANVRHLQNLCLSGDGFTSNVGCDTAEGIKKAEQLCDINCEKYLDADYEFVPIVNDNLVSYNGQDNHIFNLSTKEVNNAGLFGEVSKPLNIENTRVCWKDPSKLVKDTDSDGKLDSYVYAVSGTNAGGLIGNVNISGTDTVTITNSFAATTVKGTTTAGGLIGSVSGTVNIEKSYADCYLKSDKNAGGLAGTGTVNKLENCYAAGFIAADVTPGTGDNADQVKPEHSAGLVYGGVAACSNVYSVVRVIKTTTTTQTTTTLEVPESPLYNDPDGKPVGDDKYRGVYYLYKADDVNDAVKEKWGEQFKFGTSTDKIETHVYNLRNKLDSEDEELEPPYPYPGLKGLPHYCDWADLDVAALAYYEEYKPVSGTEPEYGFEGNKTLRKDTDNPVILKDGYALVFDNKDNPPKESSYTVTYGKDGKEQSWMLEKVTGEDGTWKWKWKNDENSEPAFKLEIKNTSGEMEYILIPLPDAVVTGELANEGDFYQKLNFNNKIYYFNPHFAKTVVSMGEEDESGEEPEEPEEPTVSNVEDKEAAPVYIRTPRHLYDLSRAYGTGGSEYYYYNKGYCFEQELDLDYGTYEGYTKPAGAGTDINEFAPKSKEEHRKQAPIGSQSDPFNGTYDGGCHIIRNVFFNSASNAGLFGYSTGKLKDVVYEMDPEKTGLSANGTNIGALVGLNGGSVKNCAVFGVRMTASATNVGGLVGQNSGSIEKCAAEVACLTMNGGKAGGLVGLNETDRTVSSSYAVGKVTGGSGTIAGLIGDNRGTVNNSYAAVYLHSGTGATTKYGLCGGTVPDNNHWLKGIFRYRGERYEADYAGDAQDASRAITIEDLLDLVDGKAWNVEGWSVAAQTVHYVIPNSNGWISDYAYKAVSGKYVYDFFPYLTGVNGLRRNEDTHNIEKDAGGNAITEVQSHYGLWPVISAGLTYYERDKKDNPQCYVQGFRPSELNTEQAIYTLEKVESNEDIDKDGYALVFGQKNIPANYHINYSGQIWTLKRTDASTYEWTWLNPPAGETGTEGSEVTPLAAPVDGKTYTVIPLPDKVVTEYLADKDHFYQEIDCGVATYYFNPHFAKTVKATDTLPADPINVKGEGVSIRTPRHLYCLSRFQNFSYDTKENLVYDLANYYFQQELDLDYNAYYDACDSYGEAAFRPERKPVANSAPGDPDHYYEQPSIAIENDDYNGPSSGGLHGTYDGGNHTIRNVFYETPSKELQYLGLFKYVNNIQYVTYEVPDKITVQLNTYNDLDGGNVDGYNDAIKVGTLMGGTFQARNCTAKVKNLTVTSSYTDIYVGGLFGYGNRPASCSVIVGSLTVKRTGAGITGALGHIGNVYAGGLAGQYVYSLDNCTSEVETLIVEGVGNGQPDNTYTSAGCYAGGLVGRSSKHTGDWSAVNDRPRALIACSATVGTLSVTGTNEETYGGGLAGWCDGMNNCSAVVSGKLSVEGTMSLYGGGLAGGGDEIDKCTAVANEISVKFSNGAAPNNNNIYVGGLVGVLKNKEGHTVQEKSDPNIHVRDSAAVGVITGSGANAWVGCLVGRSYVTGEMKAVHIGGVASEIFLSQINNCDAAVDLSGFTHSGGSGGKYAASDNTGDGTNRYLTDTWKWNDDTNNTEHKVGEATVVSGVSGVTFGETLPSIITDHISLFAPGETLSEASEPEAEVTATGEEESEIEPEA